MHEQLLSFIAELARRPFRYGELDCGLAVADWWQVTHGLDPVPHLRGSYQDEAGCRAAIGGSLPRVFSRVALAIGARRTRNPQPGDFAVIRFADQFWGAIMTPSGRWAIKCHDGLVALKSPRIVAAWSI